MFSRNQSKPCIFTLRNVNFGALKSAGKLKRSRMPPQKRKRKASTKESTKKPKKSDSEESSLESEAPVKKPAGSKQGDSEKPTYNHWLMKSEPESRIEKGIDVKFGIEDLRKCPEQTSCWDGVRNYQARNFMKDMKVGQTAFFYHSNCKEPGIIGIIKIVKEAYPDHTQFDPKDVHYDRTSDKKNPKWEMVDVKFVRKLKRYISLKELKSIHLDHVKNKGPLQSMSLFTRARLSIQPITDDEWDFILSLEDKEQG